MFFLDGSGSSYQYHRVGSVQNLYNVAMRSWQKWLSAILFFALVLRIIGFGSIPLSPYWDEMAIWDDAQSILATGRDVHNRPWFQPLFISYGDFKLPVYIWLTATASLFFRDILPSVRLPSLLAGLSFVPGVFFLTKYILNGKQAVKPALFSAFFLAVMPWAIHFSRVGFEGHVGSALVIWSMVSLWWGIRQENTKKQWLALVVSAFLGAAAVYTYFSVRFVFPVIFIAPLLLWFRQLKRRLLQFAAGLVVWLFLLVPMYRADFYKASNEFRLSAANILNQEGKADEINLWRIRSGNTILSKIAFNRWTFLAHDLAENYTKFADPGYLFLDGDRNIRHNVPGTGLMFLSMSVFFVGGIYFLLRKHENVFAYLLIWWLVAVLPAAVPTDVPHALRSLNALPVFALVLGFGGAALGEYAKESAMRRVALGLVYGILCLELFRYQYTFLVAYPRLSGAEWQDGYLQVAQYVRDVRNQYTFVYVDSFDDRFFLYYQPFSGLSWQEIQQLPSRDFRRSLFRNVRLGPIDDWQTLEHNSLVVTSPGRLPEGFAVKDEIIGAGGEERYVSAETIRD